MLQQDYPFERSHDCPHARYVDALTLARELVLNVPGILNEAKEMCLPNKVEGEATFSRHQLWAPVKTAHHLHY